MTTLTLEESLALRKAVADALDGGPAEFDFEIDGRKLRIRVMEKPHDVTPRLASRGRVVRLHP